MLTCGPYSKDCLIALRNVSFQGAGFLWKTLFRSLLHFHTGPLIHQTSTTTTIWVSQWVHSRSLGHTCLSLNWDSTAVRNKVVHSTWPRSVTAPVQLWSSSSAARRICFPIHVGIFKEWRTATLSFSWSVRVGIIRENGEVLVWKVRCTYSLHLFQRSITREYFKEIGSAMIGILTPFRQEIFGMSTRAK